MTVGYHLNVEILAKRIVEFEIEKLSESNVKPLSQDKSENVIMTLDDESFEDNFAHGFTALALMCVYMEATLNSIIRENDVAKYPYCPSVSEDVREARLAPFLRKSISDKIKKVLKIRFPVGTKENVLWSSFQHVLDVRDALIHYKKNYVQDALVPDPRMWLIGESSQVVPAPSTRINQHSIGLLFTKSKMAELWQTTQELVNYIVDQSGCMYTPDVGPVQSNGKDGFASYVVNRKLYEKTYAKSEE
ncbi:hypothetical protein [Olsenella sp. An270]|uniref:hypothetical protein n=1 Tax=Olsenella sp. An270 TaxID=1965615 RepID=UPI00117E0033|nr:hypothetical protein [Olsenella sp. An270]